MRTIDFRTAAVHRENGRFAKTYTLSYEAILSGGEVVRFIRKLTADGVERIGRTLTTIDFDDPRIANISVTDKDDNDVTFGFACFSDERPAGTVEQQRIAMALLLFIPPTAA